MRAKAFTLAVLSLSTVLVYLFASAPPPLPEGDGAGAATVPVAEALRLCNAENAAVRTLYTQEIVGAGQKVGLAFGEDWRQPGVHRGPLPALFLRETAVSLEKDPVRLSLYLGSDAPINAANRFEGEAARRFAQLRADRQPQFFYTADIGLWTAMFPDVAVAEACVTCHNDHAESPKHDWRLGDVMGATTWTYPSETVSVEELSTLVAALRRGFGSAYDGYLEKARGFASPPPIGSRWPREGYSLPDRETFLAELERRISPETLRVLLAHSSPAG